MVDLFLIRHGETDWNAEKRVQGHLDIALNEVGLQQAKAVAETLQDLPLDAIISSDLQRAMQTAQAIGSRREMVVGTHIGLRERCFGIFEGLLYSELNALHPIAYRAWKEKDLDARYPCGIHEAETLREFSQRALSAIAAIATAQDYRNVAIVTHGGVLECVYRAATGTSLQQPRNFPILNASINHVRWTPTKLQVIEWSNVKHLPLAGPLAVLDGRI
jgi:probable phosphoglycerate mutase